VNFGIIYGVSALTFNQTNSRSESALWSKPITNRILN
jgi:hypothetical protein